MLEAAAEEKKKGARNEHGLVRSIRIINYPEKRYPKQSYNKTTKKQ